MREWQACRALSRKDGTREHDRSRVPCDAGRGCSRRGSIARGYFLAALPGSLTASKVANSTL